MAYIGSTPTTQSFISGTDYFNGTGSQTSFTLSRSVGSVNDIQAVVNNVVQVPNDAYNVSGTSIVFTSAPSAGTSNVYVRYLSTTTQSITPSQNTVSYASWNSDLQSETWAFRNRIINGDMTFDQRNNGASVSAATTGTWIYTLDRWSYIVVAANKFTIQRNAGSVTPPAGFTNYLGVTSSAATSLSSGDYYILRQAIEGFNTADLSWGTANAQTVTVSFWVRSSLTGTFGGALQNNAANRSYPFSYTINAANTWEYKTVTIPGDTTGTWLTNNEPGIRLCFGLGLGSTYSGTAGAWASSELYSTTGATSVVGTSGATWYVTGVQLEKGFTATNFDVLPYGTELQLCQRYFIQYQGDTSVVSGLGGYAESSTTARFVVSLPVPMRTSPSVTFSGTARLQSGSFDSSDFTSINSVQTVQAPFVSTTFNATVTGATANAAGNLQFRANGSKLAFSAEL
jgi:hypothetical protein